MEHTEEMAERLVAPSTADLNLDETLAVVKRHERVEAIVLLGSTATGDIGLGSDYDVLLVLADTDAAAGFHVEVSIIAGRLADILVVTGDRLVTATRGPTELDERLRHWLVTGKVVLDRTGRISAIRLEVVATLSAALSPAAEVGESERSQVSYDLLVNENYATSDDPLYRLALRLRSLHSFSRLLLAYFRVRGVLWTGEKEAIRFLTVHDPAFLRIVTKWLDAPDLLTQLSLHRQAAAHVLDPVGGVWPPGFVPVGGGVWEHLTRGG